MQGCAPSTLESHLAEFSWRHRNGGDGTPAFDALIRHIAEQFPVNKLVILHSTLNWIKMYLFPLANHQEVELLTSFAVLC